MGIYGYLEDDEFEDSGYYELGGDNLWNNSLKNIGYSTRFWFFKFSYKNICFTICARTKKTAILRFEKLLKSIEHLMEKSPNVSMMHSNIPSIDKFKVERIYGGALSKNGGDTYKSMT